MANKNDPKLQQELMKLAPNERISRLILEEGAVRTPYLDKNKADKKRNWTIGVGHLLTKSELKSGKVYGHSFKGGLSNEAMLDIFLKDVAKHDKDADKVLKYHGINSEDLSGPQRDAAYDMIFQMGPNRAKKFDETFGYLRQGVEYKKEGKIKEANEYFEKTSAQISKSLWARQTPRRVKLFKERIVQSEDTGSTDLPSELPLKRTGYEPSYQVRQMEAMEKIMTQEEKQEAAFDKLAGNADREPQSEKPKGKFDVATFLEANNLFLQGRDSATGKLQVASVDNETGEEKLGTFDPAVYLQQNGVDPSTVDIIMNRPDAPIQKNALNFRDQMDLILARKPEEKLKFMQEKFGEENAQIVDGQLVVKDDTGLWSKAESGFLASMVKESPTIASGVAGSIYGTAVAGPIGTVVGGAIGAALGRITDVATAEMAGLRTESDMNDAVDEVGKEFIQSMVIGGGLMGLGKVAKFAGKTLIGPAKEALENAAETAATITRRKPDTFRTLFNPKYTKQVTALKNKLVKDVGQDGVDLATKIQVREANKVLQLAKKNSMRQYDNFKELLKRRGLGNTQVNMNETFKKVGEIKKALYDKTPGSVRESVDSGTLNKMLKMIDEIEIATKPKSAMRLKRLQELVEKTYNPAKRAKYLTQIDKIQNTPRVNQLSFDKMHKLRQNIDELMENSGYYNLGDNAISSTGRNMFKDLRNTITNSMSDSIKNTRMAQPWNDMNRAYTNFRSVYDDFAISGNKMKDAERAARTINKMMGNKGDFLTDQFKAVSELAGPSASKSYDRISVAAAAKDLTDLYAIPQGGTGQALSNVASFGMTSPRHTTSKLAFKQISDASVKAMNGVARSVNFFTNLDPKSKTAILQSPELYRQVFGTALDSINERELILTSEDAGL